MAFMIDTPNDAPSAAESLTLLTVLLSSPLVDGTRISTADRVRIIREARRGALNLAEALRLWAEALKTDAMTREG